MAKSFTFKQFQIEALDCGMPVSTDSILLGAWANICNVKSILDIGCGTGLLSIMCAQRNPLADIIGIEIENNAFKAATLNCKQSNWADRLTIQHISLQDYCVTNKTFDAIICNPPYFNSGEQSQVKQRATARHTETLSHKILLESCTYLLNDNGTASFILPIIEGGEFIELVNAANLILSGDTMGVSRLLKIKTTSIKQPSRILIELTKNAHSKKSDNFNNELMINEGGHYSSEFIELTKDFYLKM